VNDGPLDLFPQTEPLPEIVPGRKLSARVAGLYAARRGSFQSQAVEAIEFGFDGIPGDYHGGPTRRSGGREPWYPRGTEMANNRQVSLVAPDELALVAERMGLARIEPEWIGANLLVEGVPQFSMLPSGTLLFFKGGATLKVDGQNHPCRIAGQGIAENVGAADPEGLALSFVKAAKRLRGVVAWVEKPGRVVPGEEISVRLPEQWIYRA
jgi:hypothetical protein